MTIRRRGNSILRRLEALPASDWKQAVIDIPKRRHQRIRYVDECVTLRDYQGEVRQIAVKGLGREHPTLFLTNNFEASARELVMNYARRNGIEDALGSGVDFFHLDCLSSEVRLNVDLDTVLTVLGERLLPLACEPTSRLRPEQAESLVPQVCGDLRCGRD